MNRTPRQVAVLAGAIIAGLLVVLWFWGPDEQSYIDTRDAVAQAPAVTAGATVVASPAPSGPPTTSPAVAPAPVALAEHATVDAKMRRAEPIPGQALPVEPVDGVCESWRPLLETYGIPYDEALPYMRRESTCSNAHNGNGNTGDDSYGVLQTNRYGRLAAWWDEGGYTAAVMSTPEGAVAAAAVLYHSCGWGPWDKHRGYPCDGDYLQTPAPRWGEWDHQRGNQP